jgi:antitoxin component YwqK of YwqJK toxin-antitoxin module/cytochrome c551/c552
MKKLLTLILLALTVSVYGQADRDSKTYYKSGKLEMEKKYDKNCNCDKITEFYESGKLRSTKTYLRSGLINTQLEGEDIVYFEDGTIQIYYVWKDGSPTGRIYCNFADGKLAYEKFYDNKFKTGTWKFYNQDGTLKEEEVFVDNKTHWDSNDDYATDKFYFNNKLAYTVELVAGKKTNLTVIDKESYDKLIASEPPLGQKLLKQNCAACHSANVDIVGPKLKGVTDIRTTDWLIKMITNGDALIKSGDKDAVALYKKWNTLQHPNFERLSNDEVTAIIDYMRTLK